MYGLGTGEPRGTADLRHSGTRRGLMAGWSGRGADCGDGRLVYGRGTTGSIYGAAEHLLVAEDSVEKTLVFGGRCGETDVDDALQQGEGRKARTWDP